MKDTDEVEKRGRGRPSDGVPKTNVNLTLPIHVVEYFKRSGPGHLTRMQAVLTAFAAKHTQRFE